MASSSTRIAPSSSSSSAWKYEVFLSFHGKNTRHSFTDHLWTALVQNGIIVFRDDSEMKRGEPFPEELFKTIEQSLYAIVVISENYASSEWCLKELTKIMYRRKEGCMKVFPVFYHVDPSDVRNLTGSFGEAFIQDIKESVEKELVNLWTATLEEVSNCIIRPSDTGASASRNDPKVKTWSDALTEVGFLAGWHVHNNSPESRVIQEISKKVWEGRMRNLQEVPKFLVGMESQLTEMWRLLELGSADVRFAGICGMEGIGKTTLARVIYGRVSSQFDSSCFVAEIGEAFGREVVRLQKYLISKILAESAASMLNHHDPVDKGIEVLSSVLKEKRVLIVLDDVRQGEQINALAGSAKWFGKGSRIIITSTARDLLHLSDDNIYSVNALSPNDARELFHHNAFLKFPTKRVGYSSEEDFMLSASPNSIDLILDCADGHPLAVEVFGSFFRYVKKENQWKDYVERSRKNLDKKVSDKLEIPLKGLDKSVRELFIDIACFFNKWYEDHVISKLESLGYSSDSILRLEHKCLIKFSQDRKLLMHGLLEKMGKEFAEGSRLWHIEDIISVSRKKSEIGKVIGVALKSLKSQKYHLNAEGEQLCYDVCSDVFSKMDKLRMLRISLNDDDDKNRGNEQMGGSRHSLSFKLNGELRLMEWSGYPLRSLSIEQSSRFLDLVELNLRNSLIEELWDENKNFRLLKHVDLSSSKKLIKIPNLSQASALEVLDLSFCESLKEVDSSIGGLENLKKLLLSGCHELRELPDKLSSKYLEVLVLSECSELKRFPDISCSSHCLKNLDLSETAIKESASSNVKFSSLKVLNLSCSRISDEAKHLDFSGLNRLQALDLCGNSITKLPDTLRGASNLQQLSLDGCSSLKELSVSLFLCLRLSKLSLSNCNLSDDSIPESISCWHSISSLDLSKNRFTKLPENMPELSKLEKLTLDGCRTLRTLPKLPLSLRSLHLEGCPLETSDCSRNSPILGYTLQKSFRFCTIAYVGFGGRSRGIPYKILDLHSQSPPYMDDREHLIEPRAVCGPTFRYEIPNEFIQERDRSDKEARIQMDWQSDDEGPSACALWIVYLVTGESRKRKHNELGSSNVGACKDNNHIFREFFCELQLNETSPEQNPQLPCQSQPSEESPVSFVIRVPKVAGVRPSYRAWVFMVIPDSIRERKYKKRNISESLQESEAMKRWSYSASVRACSENVGLMECRARLFGEDATISFSQFKTSISSGTLDEQSPNHALEVLSVTGPIQVV